MQLIVIDVEPHLPETVLSNNPGLESHLLALRITKFVQIVLIYLIPLTNELHLHYRYKLVNIA